jgi:hypothetical protein
VHEIERSIEPVAGAGEPSGSQGLFRHPLEIVDVVLGDLHGDMPRVHPQGDAACLLLFFLRNHLEGGHAGENPVPAVSRGVGHAKGGVPVGGPDDPREEGGLLEGQVIDALGEVKIRRVFHPVYPAGTFLSEVDLVQVRLEDLLLGEANLEEYREFGLPDLPPEAFLRRKEEIFRELLGDGGPSLYDPHPAQVCSQGPHDPDEVDPEVRVEAGVLRREHRVPEVLRNGVERNHPPRLHLRSEDPGDLLRFEDKFLERGSGQSFQGDDASLRYPDLGPDAWAGSFSRLESPGPSGRKGGRADPISSDCPRGPPAGWPPAARTGSTGLPRRRARAPFPP